MRKHQKRLLVVFCLAILGIFGLALLVILSGPPPREIGRRRLFVPISLGDRTVRSGLVIECDVTDYNMPFSIFRNSANRDERRVADFISALLSGNTEKAKALSNPEATIGGKTIEGSISMLRSHWARIGISSDSSNLKIGRRIYWGNQEYFICGKTDPNSLNTIILGFQRDSKEGLLWSQRMEGLEIMLWKIAEQRRKYPKDYDIEPSGSYDYRFTVITQNSKHPVDLLFNGRVHGVTQAEEQPHSSDAALLFYKSAIAALKEGGSIEEFREIGNKCYDAHSREKFRRWIDKDNEAFLESINEYARMEREVLFVMDANPVFIVFYRPEGMSDWHIRHDYVVREKGRFFITRWAWIDRVTEAFQSRKMFIEPLLMPLIESEHRGGKLGNDSSPTQ
ncbi:MAG: hypothetical protein ACYS8Z_23915 [Planctomycetota bacterium]